MNTTLLHARSLLKTESLVFLSGFSVFLVTLLLLGETFIGVILFALLMCFVGLFSLVTKTPVESKYKSVIFGSVILSFLIVVLGFFSKNQPSTLLETTRVIGSMWLFVWFLVTPFGKGTQLFFARCLVGITLLLGLLSVVFLILPSHSPMIPGINLIFPTFGHNHIAALLLLVIPIAWYFYRQNDEEKTKGEKRIIAQTVVLALLLFLLSSLGRVAIFLGFLQFLFLVRESKKVGVSLLIVSLFLSCSVFYLAFSLPWVQSANPFCYSDVLKKKLCKVVTSEARPLYWQQALAAVKEYPLTGYGLGTFNLISRRYAQMPFVATSFAHNQFLQWFAELGVVGGGVLAGFFAHIYWLLLKVYKKARKNSFERYLVIAAFTSLFNSFFDFDWSFISIFIITLIFIALALQNGKDSSEEKSSFVLLTSRSYASLLLTVGLGVIVLFSTVEILIAAKKADTAIAVFPYFSAHSKLFFQQTLSEHSKAILKRIYTNSPEFWLNYTEIGTHETLYTIDPWQRIYQPLIKQRIDNKQYVQALDDAEKIIEMLERSRECCGYAIDHSFMTQMSSELGILLKHFFSTQDTSQTLRVLRLLAKIEPWVIRQSILLESPVDTPFFYSIVSRLDFVPIEFLVYEKVEFREAYLESIAQVVLEHQDQSDFTQAKKTYLHLFNEHKNFEMDVLAVLMQKLRSESGDKERVWQKSAQFLHNLTGQTDPEVLNTLVSIYTTAAKGNHEADLLVARKIDAHIDELLAQGKVHEAEQWGQRMGAILEKEYWVDAKLKLISHQKDQGNGGVN